MNRFKPVPVYPSDDLAVIEYIKAFNALQRAQYQYLQIRSKQQKQQQ